MISNLFDILKIIGSVALFIYSTVLLTKGVQKAAGNELRKILATVTSNRFFGVFAGFLVTIMVQSSSATSVMVVSYVNSGIITFAQSIGVVMGTNIGTTSTGWLLSVLGFELNIIEYVLPIAALSVPFLFAVRGSLRAVSDIFNGFALMFISFYMLSLTLPILASYDGFVRYLAFFENPGIFSTFLFVLCGTVLTLICRSSSAAMAITMVAAFQGWLSFEAAAGIILGENIGTTVTANLAAQGGSTNARRTAFAHFLFNVFGIFWMLVLFTPYLSWIGRLTEDLIGSNPLLDSAATPIGLSMFHTTFNLLNMLLLIGFVKPLEMLTKKVVSVAQTEEDRSLLRLELLTSDISTSPEFSMDEVKKEIIKYGQSTQLMIQPLTDLLYEQDDDRVKRLTTRISKMERSSDHTEEELVRYLVKVSERSMSENASLRMRGLLAIIGDLERIGDIFFQMAKTLEAKNHDKAWFTPNQRNGIREMIDLLEVALIEMNKNLQRPPVEINLSKSVEAELKINQLRDTLKAEHLKSIDKKGTNIRSGFLYVDLYSSGERMGDVIMGINETLKSIP